jgi:tRNA (cmo5U34)-methyltransferase
MTDDAGPDERAEAYWGARAREYNGFIVRVVPRYTEMIGLVLAYAPSQARRVLELGTGTGNLSLRLAERWPDAHFTFVDGAAEMLDVTRERLRARAPQVAARARFLAARFEELELEPASIDVVIASLSLHHVQEVGAIYARIGPALSAGGRLIMLDGLAGATSAEHDTHMARWQEYWHAPGRLSEAEIHDVAEHVEKHDHYRPLADHVEMLLHAGFTYVDCVWRDGIFALVTAGRGR